MTPVAAFAIVAALSALMLIALAALVIRQRFAQRVSLAHGAEDGPLHRAARAHANFVENAPLFLILLLAMALLGAGALIIGGLGGVFLIARIAHAYGVSVGVRALLFRQAGMALTWAATFLAAGIAVGIAFGTTP